MSGSRSATVSLCMIVRNEGHQLAACLAPVAELFDDIVVVDTGSDDDTRQVAQRCRARVFDFAWCDDFSAARNHALAQARGDWIFWLDADDRLSPPNAQKLHGLLAALADRPQAYLMETVLHLDELGRDRERLTSHLRLFRRHPALCWQRRVHEALTPWPTALGHELLFSDVRIDHLGYCDPHLTQRKLRRNVRLLRMDFAIAPDDPCVLMDLGSAYAQLGNAADARRCLHAVLAYRTRCPLLGRRAYTTLGELETAEGDFAAAATLLAQALGSFPGDDYLLYLHSEALYNLGRYPQAKAALLEILGQPPGEQRFQVGVPADLRRRLVPLALGEVLRVEVALREAAAVLRGVVDEFPHDPSAWFFLGRVYIDWRDWDQVDEIAARLGDCPQGQLFAELLRAWSQVSHGQFLAAEATLDRLIPQAPLMTLPRMLRAESMHRRNAPHAAQVQACRDVLRLQPHNHRAGEILRSVEAALATRGGADAASLYTSVVLNTGVAAERHC